MRKSDMKHLLIFSSPHLLISLLSCCFFFAILSPYASAHDAFYPHHKQDFQELQQNRGRIAVVTAVFLTLLTIGIVFGLRKGDWDVNEDIKAAQMRLRQYALEAAKTAIALLKDNPSQALKASLQTYAQMAGVSQNREQGTGNREQEKGQKDKKIEYVSSISCKIGEDLLKARIFRKGALVNLELIATFNEAGAKVVVIENGEIHSSVFIN